MTNSNPTSRDRIRIYVTGSCDGLDRLRDGLASHPELDFVGWSEHVAEATAALAGGHLQVVVHATRDTTLPAAELAAIREHTRAPIVMLASGESSALLDDALETEGVADVLLLPQLTENVVFALRKAAHAGRRLHADGAHASTAGSSPCSRRRAGRARPSSRRTSPPRSRRTREASAPARPGPPVRGRGDHARASSRRRRSTTSSPRRASSTRRSSPAT